VGFDKITLASDGKVSERNSVFIRTVDEDDTHNRPLYLACPEVLSLVGQLLSEYGWGSSDPHIVLTIFMYLFVFEMQRLNLFTYSNNNRILNKRKANSQFIPELVTCCFRLSHFPPPHSHHSRTRMSASPNSVICCQPFLV
jgi:hypothetical protein